MVLTDARDTSGFTHLDKVAGHVREILLAAPLTPAYRQALTAALEVPGRILSAAPDARWTQCDVTCCAAARGQSPRAVPAAAAIEFFMVALELLDDEEDAEPSSLRSDLGASRVLNVSTGLLILAQNTLTKVCSAGAAEVLQYWALRSCDGQDADLGGRAPADVGLAESLALTERKSGSLVAAACQLGALVSGADSTRQDMYAQFGRCLGVVAQLANDVRAVSAGSEGKTDMELQRPTLPLVYAVHEPSRQWEREEGGAEVISSPPIASVAFTWVVADTYRRRALGMIPVLTDDPEARNQLALLVGSL